MGSGWGAGAVVRTQFSELSIRLERWLVKREPVNLSRGGAQTWRRQGANVKARHIWGVAMAFRNIQVSGAFQ